MILTKEIVKENNLINKDGHCTIPGNYTVIESCAFLKCTNLKSIFIPNSVIKIRNNAFSGCINLSSVNIPSSLDIVSNDIFNFCTSLPKINVGKEILKMALKNNYFEQYYGLCICFKEIVSELILKYRKPICLGVELPMFTRENAKLFANGTYYCYWFKDNSDRRKFLGWMLSEISKNDFNDEILILRR